MKILTIADIHGNKEAVEKAKEFATEEGIEHILILGDFPSYGRFGEMEGAQHILDSLKDFNLFVIPGNCDSRELIPFLRKKDFLAQ